MMEGTFFFDPKDKIYKDHFPENPVVPGSVIIHAFSLAVKKYMDDNTENMGNTNDMCDANNVDNVNKMDLTSVRGFRFKRFIAPGCYEYTLSMDENVNERIVECRLFDRGQIVATGRVSL